MFNSDIIDRLNKYVTYLENRNSLEIDFTELNSIISDLDMANQQ